MRHWPIRKLWPGQTVFILGGGPSLLDQDLSPIHDKRVIGINDAFKLGSWIDICWWSDCRWGVWNHKALCEYQGLNISCTRCNCQHPSTLQVRRKNGFGIGTNPEEVMWNRSSGGSAINLAYLLGAKKVILLGYDMKMRENEHNWHNNHKHRPRAEVYEDRFLPPFEKIALDAEKLGLEIINATPDSALKVFPIKPLEEVM